MEIDSQAEAKGNKKALRIARSNRAGEWAHRALRDFREAFKVQDHEDRKAEKEVRQLFASRKKSARGLARRIVSLFTELTEEQVRKLEVSQSE